MAHLTAGDVYPILAGTESSYATTWATPTYYADVAEGGRITFTDTPNPHLAWRYGARTRDIDDYVSTQQDAGFTASLEARDVSGWERIVTNAYTDFGTSLPSRVASVRVTGASDNVRSYYGCKTDSLTISADAPGAVVKFEETVLAAYASTTLLSSALPGDAAGVQWLGGMTYGGTTIYPQRFSLSIANNLERIRGPARSGQTIGRTSTIALVEGRCEINLEMEVWLDDLSYMADDMANTDAPATIGLTLGTNYPATFYLVNPSWVADGSHADLKQDKMTQTLRFRVGSISVA